MRLQDSIRLVYHADDKDHSEPNPGTKRAHMEFTFDADIACQVTLYLGVSEITDVNGVTTYSAKYKWPTHHFEAGLFQQYAFPSEMVNFDQFADEDLFVDQCGPRKYPLVIDIQANVPDHPKPHAHATFATFDRAGDANQMLTCKPIVQRLSVEGLTFVLKEIYGIENKDESGGGGGDDDNTECVVCMSEVRDTMALPCRHLCLCNDCAEVLRYQNNKCPICRTIFHSLLQIRVLRDKDKIDEEDLPEDASEDEETKELVPPGFALVSLVTALTNSREDQEALEARASDGAVIPARASQERVPVLPLAMPTAAGEAAAGGAAEQGLEAGPASLPDAGEDLHHSFTGRLDGGEDDDDDMAPVQGKGKGKATASSAEVIQEREDLGHASVKMHDFPSNERLEVEDTVVAVDAETVAQRGVSEFKLPGTPDTESKMLRKQTDSSGGSGGGSSGGSGGASRNGSPASGGEDELAL